MQYLKMMRIISKYILSKNYISSENYYSLSYVSQNISENYELGNFTNLTKTIPLSCMHKYKIK
jgi:hypothetical protein